MISGSNSFAMGMTTDLKAAKYSASPYIGSGGRKTKEVNFRKA